MNELEIEPDFNKAIQAGKELQSLVQHPGWKSIDRFLQTIANPVRLKLNEATINNAQADSGKLGLMLSFIGGEISTVDKLANFVNAKINYGKNLQNKLNAGPLTPELSDKEAANA